MSELFRLRKYNTGAVGEVVKDRVYGDRVYVHLKSPKYAITSLLIDNQEEALALFHLLGDYLLISRPGDGL